jgi:phage baseplate assembly protein V
VNRPQPGSRVADKRYYGVAEGIVTAVEDPQRECRVRVRLPWFDADEVTDWCRTTHLFAGNGYGSTWTPEVGDEVLIAFVHGDMRFPIVLGGLYNGADKPPSSPQADRNEKFLRSKAGHEIVVDDSPSRMGVRVTTKAGHRLVLDDRAERLELMTKSGHGLAIDDRTGDVILKGTTITIEATGSISITSKAEVSVDGTMIKLN